MKKGKIFQMVVVAVCLVWSGACASENLKTIDSFKNMPFNPPGMINPFQRALSKPKIIKSKTYYMNTVAIIWVDITGDGKCNIAYLLEKSGDHIVVTRMPCEQADGCDMIMEPKV
jgi:hypothetical protein